MAALNVFRRRYSQMEELAKKLMAILVNEGQCEELGSVIDSESKRIPFIHSFPKNSCEYTSYFLAKIYKENFGCKSLVVNGTCGGEEHYWVEVDDKIYDITIGQFCGQPAILLGENINDVSCLVANQKTDIEIAFNSWDQEHKESWVKFIQTKLLG